MKCEVVIAGVSAVLVSPVVDWTVCAVGAVNVGLGVPGVAAVCSGVLFVRGVKLVVD